jgi:hypothetical protein
MAGFAFSTLAVCRVATLPAQALYRPESTLFALHGPFDAKDSSTSQKELWRLLYCRFYTCCRQRLKLQEIVY